MNPMQGERSPIDSSIEVTNIDEEPVSSLNSQTSLNNMPNPMDNRFSNYTIPSGGSTYMSSSARDVQNFNGWSSSEPSYRLGPSDQANDMGAKMGHGLPSDSFLPHSSYSSEERQPDSTSTLFPGRLHIGHGGNQVRSGPLILRDSSSNHIPQTVNLSADMRNSGNGGQSSGVIIRANNSENSFGSSTQVREENGGASGSSLGNWGSSCKRKALEGASGHSFPSGSSGCLSQAESGIWQPGSSQNDASSSLSTPLQNSSYIGQWDQPRPQFGVGAAGVVARNAFPSTRNTETSTGPFGRRLTPGEQHASVPFSLSSPETSVRSNVSSLHRSPLSTPFGDPLDVRSMAPITANSSATESQSNIIHLPGLTRNIHQFAWNRASSSRTSNSSSSLTPGERFVAHWDDVNSRNIPRNNSEHHMFAPANEMRNPVQDQSFWSLSRGNPSASGDVPFASRAGPSSSMHSLQPNPPWIPPQNTSIHNPQRIPELASWSLFPSIESESANSGSSFPLFPTGPAISSSTEAAMPSGSTSRSHQPRPRRSGLLLERRGEDAMHMRHLGRSIAADNDGRHRLISEIRQVLNAMRRGENLHIEDYMVFNPLIYHGMAEIHDRHRDMRLDVDNMSYEELLALGERIGDVSTGLSEETILKVMKQRKYTCVANESQQDVEPCCICQEEYAEGDDVGKLDCGHDFHTECIKQWIMLKNLCPICKTAAFST